MATQAAKTSDRKSTDGAGSDELMAELDALRKEVSAVTDRLAQLGNVGMNTAKSTTRQAKETVRANSEALANELVGLGEDLDAKAREAIVRQPLQSVLIAAGLGLLAGYLIRR